MKLKKARRIYAGQQNVMVSRKGKLVNIEDAPEKWDQRKVISANKDGKMQILILGKKVKKKDSDSELTEGFDQFISETEMLIGDPDGKKKKKKKHDKDKERTGISSNHEQAQKMHNAVRPAANPQENKPEKAPVRENAGRPSNEAPQKKRPGRPPRNRKPETTEKASEETKEEASKEETK